MKKQILVPFEELISLENLLQAWEEFVVGKKQRRDVQEFSFNLMDNLLILHDQLARGTYKHGGYQAFNISDPKPRSIHKASVQDRLLHHAICRKLYSFYDSVFVADSYSCRVGKGTHAAVNRFQFFARKVSKNNTKTCWVLKGDIKKFFANVDHEILQNVLESHIPGKSTRELLNNIINSFHSNKVGVGLPLGNLTSQLFVNIYLNELDQFIKHQLRAKYYIRYCDDFVILSEDKTWLLGIISVIREFLLCTLRLALHPDKVFIKTLASGVDFLGWIQFPNHRVLRTVTKRRILRGISNKPIPESVQSYSGLLAHGNTQRTRQQLFNAYYTGKKT